MKRAIPVFIMLALCFVNTGVAQDISGKWTGKMEGREEPFDIIVTFQTNADTLTGIDTLAGTVSGPMGTLPIRNGKVNGKEFSFDMMFGRTTISHQCTMRADSISMRYVGMEGKEREIVLKRLAEPKQ